MTIGSPPPNVLLASANPVQIIDGANTRTWRLSPEASPATYWTSATSGERRQVCFASEQQRICRSVQVGDSIDFSIRYDGIDYPTRIQVSPPAAEFDVAYQAAHRGQTEILVPEVYEMVSIAISLTPTVRANRFLIARTTPYYQDLESWFSGFADHPFVAALERELVANPRSGHFNLKMNGYAFVFDNDGRVQRSSIYDRTGFADNAPNTLGPHIELMRSFAEQSRFRTFYLDHLPLYQEQISFLREQANIPGMRAWLRREFPGVRDYDGMIVLFSPTQWSNQSVTHFESNGYRELMPHVLFPYPRRSQAALSPSAAILSRGAMIFTEINHGFINPAAEPYRSRIAAAFRERGVWVAANTAADFYPEPHPLFLEHMNWGLVSLYYYDFAPPAARDALIARVVTVMSGEGGRGFIAFPEFNNFLVELYANRPPGATIESLYPQIIAWCEAHQETALSSQGHQ